MLHVSTAGPWEASLADYWDLFLSEFTRAVSQPLSRFTLGHAFRQAEARYYAQNAQLRAHNESVQRTQREHAPLSFGTVHLHEGKAADGRPMSDVPIWDLLLEEVERVAGLSG